MNLPTLQQVDNYPLPEMLVPRIAKEHGYDMEKAELIAREARRMLYLHAVSKQVVSPSERVDHGWHAMLMFTRFYQEFADFIGVFVHHDPTPGPPDGGRTYVHTKQMYKEYFNQEPDSWLWP